MTILTARSPAVMQVSLTQALEWGPDVWDRLLARSGSGNPFMSWAWYRACADAVPVEEVRACHAVVQGGTTDDVEGLFPFRIQRERFRGIPVTSLGWAFGDLGCPDHLGFLASPEADLDTVTLRLGSLPWVVMRLGGVDEAGTNVERFYAACERRGWTVRRRPLRRCPYLDLPESWEAYLASLSAHARGAIRRKERKLRREHDVVLMDYGHERLDEGLRHLERLHAMRWGGGGAFRDRAMERLHRRFAASLADRGQLWLVTLDLDGTPAAAWYGFSHGDTVYHYQSGRDPRWERARVGTVLMSLMLRRAIARGYRTMDLLRGEESYKMEWTSSARQCYEIVVFRPGWNGAALRAVDWMVRRLRDTGSRLTGDRLRQWLAESG